MLNTIKKVEPILDLFTPEQPEWGVTQIAETLGMPKSNVHAVVSTLSAIGLLTGNARGRYRLGWKLLTLSERMRASVDVATHARPVMRRLGEATREQVLLAVLDRDRVLYIERVEGTHPTVRLAGVRIGARVPVHCTAAGKVLVADLQPRDARQLLAGQPMLACTSRTIQSVDEYEAELTKVRAQGLAYDHGEAVPDVCCVAAPVYDAYGMVIAALSVSVPGYRFERNAVGLRDALVTATESLSAQLAEVGARAPDEADAGARRAPFALAA